MMMVNTEHLLDAFRLGFLGYLGLESGDGDTSCPWKLAMQQEPIYWRYSNNVPYIFKAYFLGLYKWI